MSILRLLSLTVLLSVLFGCSQGDDPAPPENAAQIAQGEALFNQHCTECHPRSGRGDYLKRIPATLLTRRSEHELITWIEGRDMHREMPSFTQLNEEERLALAAFLLNRIKHP